MKVYQAVKVLTREGAEIFFAEDTAERRPFGDGIFLYRTKGGQAVQPMAGQTKSIINTNQGPMMRLSPVCVARLLQEVANDARAAVNKG
jgi:hypothetical protein